MTSNRSAVVGRTRIVGLAITLASSLAVCSDGGLSKEDYIAKADAICASLESEVRNLKPPASKRETTAFVARLRELVARTTRSLKELPPPAEDEEKIDAFLDKVEESARSAFELAEAQRRGEDLTRETVEEVARLRDEVAKTAKEYGFKRCGSDSSS